MEKNYNGVSLALGICGIVIGILGGITFGIIGAIIGIILSVAGIILGVNTQKATGNTQGKGGFICGIIGAAFSVIFLVGCLSCGGSYGKWGCIGGCNSLTNDAKNSIDDVDWDDVANKINDALKDAQ